MSIYPDDQGDRNLGWTLAILTICLGFAYASSGEKSPEPQPETQTIQQPAPAPK